MWNTRNRVRQVAGGIFDEGLTLAGLLEEDEDRRETSKDTAEDAELAAAMESAALNSSTNSNKAA